jgi:prepilin-type processing-associated H-X9-DG protein
MKDKPRKSSLKNKLGCAVASVGAVLGLAALLLPMIFAARSGAKLNTCNNHLKQLGIALLNYESVYKSFPPAYVADADGKPMHSWRVLLLPFLERQDVYKKYDFNEPWNGPHNRQLAGEMDSVFRCPEATGDSQETSYVAVVGSDTGWPGATPIKIRDMKDGPSKTIAIVEVANSGINWMEPRDLKLIEAMQGVTVPGHGPGLKISSNHAAGGANVGYFDAHVSFLPVGFSPEVLRGLLTAAGGEIIRMPD